MSDDDELNSESRFRRLDEDLEIQFGNRLLSDDEDNQDQHEEEKYDDNAIIRVCKQSPTATRLHSTTIANTSTTLSNRRRSDVEREISELNFKNSELYFELKTANSELAKYQEENEQLLEILREKDEDYRQLLEKLNAISENVRRLCTQVSRNKAKIYTQQNGGNPAAWLE